MRVHVRYDISRAPHPGARAATAGQLPRPRPALRPGRTYPGTRTRTDTVDLQLMLMRLRSLAAPRVGGAGLGLVRVL